MKIIGGKYKGRNFYMPESIRPTQNITRKAIFDILGHNLEQMTFLELFAGSGAVGMEALSREAQKVVFVEQDSQCVEVIHENLKLIGIREDMEDRYEVINRDALDTIAYLAKQKRKFDIIFMDPPYRQEIAKKALKALEAYDILAPACWLIVQYEQGEILPEHVGNLDLYKIKKYGSSCLSIYTRG